MEISNDVIVGKIDKLFDLVSEIRLEQQKQKDDICAIKKVLDGQSKQKRQVLKSIGMILVAVISGGTGDRLLHWLTAR